MMKKLLLVVLSLAISVSCIAGLTSCSTTNTDSVDDDTKASIDMVKQAKEKIDAVSNVMFSVMENTDSTSQLIENIMKYYKK